MSQERAVLAGSFDPITNGHIDLIQRGLKIFEGLIVAVAYNPEKAHTALFTPEERVALIQATLGDDPRLEVDAFPGLLVHYARRRGARVILRGLRAVSDYEFEVQMALMNRCLAPDVETFFMMAAEGYSYISSRLVKEIASLGGDVRGFVPEPVRKAILDKLAPR